MLDYLDVDRYVMVSLSTMLVLFEIFSLEKESKGTLWLFDKVMRSCLSLKARFDQLASF